MHEYLTIFLITALTGVGGLALGGGFAAAIHSPSDRSVSLLLRFTAGVMVSVVCFDLIADATEDSAIWPVIVWILIGYFGTYLLNCWIDKQAHHSHSHGSHDHHDHHHHHADEIFTSWGRETAHQYTEGELEQILKALSEGEAYGTVLRAKGIIPVEGGLWKQFDLVPGEYEVREGQPDYTGRLCVIGTDLKEEELAVLFHLS